MVQLKNGNETMYTDAQSSFCLGSLVHKCFIIEQNYASKKNKLNIHIVFFCVKLAVKKTGGPKK